MRLFDKEELQDIEGDVMVLYGGTGVGKSVSVIQTARDPIFYFLTEPRSPKKFLIAADRPDVNIRFGFYDNWEDTLDFFSNPENVRDFNTVVIDSLTFLSNVCLAFEIEDEAYDARSAKEKADKPLISRAKMSVEGYGGLSGQLSRFTKMISGMSQAGKTVIMLALLDQNPKFNRELIGGPLLMGKAFGKALPGFCDFIGLVEDRLDENGKKLYPPSVNFNGVGYECKWTGHPMPPKGFPWLNVGRILDTAHGRNKKGGKKEEVVEAKVKTEQLSLINETE